MTVESHKEQRHRRKKGEERLLKKQLRSDSVFHHAPNPSIFIRLLSLLTDADAETQEEQSVGSDEFNRLNYFQEVRDEYMNTIYADICSCIRPQHLKRGLPELKNFEDFVVVVKDMAMVHPSVLSMRRKKHRLIFCMSS